MASAIPGTLKGIIPENCRALPSANVSTWKEHGEPSDGMAHVVALPRSGLAEPLDATQRGTSFHVNAIRTVPRPVCAGHDAQPANCAPEARNGGGRRGRRRSW